MQSVRSTGVAVNRGKPDRLLTTAQCGADGICIQMVLADQPAITMREHGDIIAKLRLPVGVIVNLAHGNVEHTRETRLQRIDKFIAQRTVAPGVEDD